MTTFESSVSIKNSLQEVYNFLADLNNHSNLMPENVTDWSSTTKEATFAIKNMAKLAIGFVSKTKDSEIIIKSIPPSPFEIEMRWTINILNNETLVNLILSAQLSSMLKMMASTALQKFVDHQTSALKISLN